MLSICHAHARSAARRLCAAAVACACLLPLTSPGATAQQQRQQQQATANNAEQQLAAAIYAYNHDDISAKTEQQFKTLAGDKRYAGTKEAEKAQYFLASFYQRKFYIQRAKLAKGDDRATLEAAQREYRRYTDTYYRANTERLADSFFNLALVNWQLGDKPGAYNELNKLAAAAGKDGSVYIYEVVWSQSSQDVIDAYLPTQKLAAYTLKVLTGNPNQPFEQAVRAIRQWCQGQR